MGGTSIPAATVLRRFCDAGLSHHNGVVIRSRGKRFLCQRGRERNIFGNGEESLDGDHCCEAGIGGVTGLEDAFVFGRSVEATGLHHMRSRMHNA